MNKTLSKNTLLVHSGSNPKMALGLKVLKKPEFTIQSKHARCQTTKEKHKLVQRNN